MCIQYTCESHCDDCGVVVGTFPEVDPCPEKRLNINIGTAEAMSRVCTVNRGNGYKPLAGGALVDRNMRYTCLRADCQIALVGQQRR